VPWSFIPVVQQLPLLFTQRFKVNKTTNQNGYTLGLSCFYHDSAVSLTYKGKIIGALQQERISRIKNDDSFPFEAIETLLKEHDISPSQIAQVVYYEKPFLTFERLLETYHAYFPKGFFSYLKVMPIWIKEKIFIKSIIKKELKKLAIKNVPLYFPSHHHSHMAAAYYPSPFDKAAILTLDGVGEWETLSLGIGEGTKIRPLATLNFPHSLGLFYSSFTYFCGFKVNSGEYKLMGLAPYAHEELELVDQYQKTIENHLIDIREDGSFLLNQKYFSYATAFKMVPEKIWEELFNIPVRKPETDITREYAALALACQKVTEKVILKLVHSLKELSGCENLCLAGGVALNSVANGLIVREGPFKKVWIQPASGDAGSALGCALAVDNILFADEALEEKNKKTWPNDHMLGALLGPSFSSEKIEDYLKKSQTKRIWYKFENNEELIKKIVEDLTDQKVVGLFQGKSEFGPRALGSRSILADPRNPSMQKKVNLKIKLREGFRPFAPAALEEDCNKYYNAPYTSPYMQVVHSIFENAEGPSIHSQKEDDSLSVDNLPSFISRQLKKQNSPFPAVTHVDGSARIQVVRRENHPFFYDLLKEFKKQTEVGILLNTSFNIRGEPIVFDPMDALNCFEKTQMDVLYLENYRISK